MASKGNTNNVGENTSDPDKKDFVGDGVEGKKGEGSGEGAEDAKDDTPTKPAQEAKPRTMVTGEDVLKQLRADGVKI